MDREIRYIIICDSFDFFINVHYWMCKLIDWTKGLTQVIQIHTLLENIIPKS